VSLDLVVDPTPGAEELLATLDGAGDERWVTLDSLVAALLVGPRAIEVGVSGHEAAAADRARDFEQLLGMLERLGPVRDARDGRPLVGAARAEAIREFAGG
jgi:hypothetical protein